MSSINHFTDSSKSETVFACFARIHIFREFTVSQGPNKYQIEKQNMAKADIVGSSSAIRRPDPNGPNGKKIEYEERRDRLQKLLEKLRAKSSNDPKN